MIRHVSEHAGKQLRALRKRRAMSQEYVAECMRSVGFVWTRSTVGDVETGRRPITLDELCVLSVTFGVDAADFLPEAS